MEAGRLPLTDQHTGQFAEIGACAGLDDDRRAGAAQHIAADDADVWQIGRRIAAAVKRHHRLAGLPVRGQ